MSYRFKQCVNSIAFKYFSEQYPNYLNEVFNVATERNYQLRGSFQKLICQFCKTNTGQLALSYIDQTLWNTTLDSQDNLKSFFLSELKDSNNSF